ncbi:7273_t:CDS:2 [Entrophospora sp. SA101]|nr:7273_t:CDS:2 [Entrophospora sp. SA101]
MLEEKDHNVDKLICGTNEALHIWDMKSGKRVCDLLTGLSVWQVKFDEQMCVAAVQKNSETWFEIFDFNAL